MIDNNILSNRLNDFKKGSFKDPLSSPMNLAIYLTLIWNVIILLGNSFIFGYSLNILLGTSWNIASHLIIGYSIILFFNYFKNLFHPKP